MMEDNNHNNGMVFFISNIPCDFFYDDTKIIKQFNYVALFISKKPFNFKESFV